VSPLNRTPLVIRRLARELGLAAEKLTDGPRSADCEAALTDSTRTEYAEAIKSLGVAWEKLGAVHSVVQAPSLLAD
jgi:hypothetical protein